MSRLIIEASTPLCLLQDAGRFGVRHLGVTQGGALDWVSMSWANWLLGNALDAPVVVAFRLPKHSLQAEFFAALLQSIFTRSSSPSIAWPASGIRSRYRPADMPTTWPPQTAPRKKTR